jgi:hypothetical protein
MKAWLVTWEWVGDHAKREKKVAAVLNPRLGGARVRELVEFLYATENYTTGELMALAKGGKNPYPAIFGTLNGAPWEGQIHCGHNPFLFARLVDDLKVERDEHGMETPLWKERPKLDMSWMHNE